MSRRTSPHLELHRGMDAVAAPDWRPLSGGASIGVIAICGCSSMFTPARRWSPPPATQRDSARRCTVR